MTGGDADQRLAVMIDTNERHRTRSRAVATLLAAAAAGLAAALVLSPTSINPHLAQVIGTFAVVSLVLATAAFIAASLVYSGTHYIRTPIWRRVVAIALFWRLTPPTEERHPEPAILEAAAEKIQARISHISNAGAMLAGLGVVALVACFGVAVLDQTTRVQITLQDPAQAQARCPKYASPFPATVSHSDLQGGANDVRVVLRGQDCGVASDVLIFVPRTAITFESKSGF